MNEMKSWYASRTIWGSVVAILASCANLAGVEIGADDQRALIEGLTALAAVVGGLIALYGRIRANTRVGR